MTLGHSTLSNGSYGRSTSSCPHGLDSHFTLRSHSTIQGASPTPCHMHCGRGVASCSYLDMGLGLLV